MDLEDDTDGFTIELDGAVLSGIERGDGVPVVFLHAGVADHRMWLAQVAAVAEAGYHAVAYDRRGFGETTATDEPFSHLDDLVELLDALDIHAAVLVGSSMGGALAVDFALTHPGRTAGLVLIGTALSGFAPEISDTDELMEAAIADAEERGDPEFIARVYAHAWLDGPRSASGRVAGPLRERVLATIRNNLAKPVLRHERRASPALDRVPAIVAPTLLIAGDLDFDYTVALHETLSEDLPNVFAAVIEGTAHFPSLERPDLVDPLLVQFLDSLTGGD